MLKAVALSGVLQDNLIRLRVMKGDKRPFKILNNVNATLKPASPPTLAIHSTNAFGLMGA